MGARIPALAQALRRRAAVGMAAAAGVLCTAVAGPAIAQPQAVPQPNVEVRPLDGQGPVIGYIAPPPAPEAVARTFVEGCIAREGDMTSVVDWALSEGFEPRDSLAPESQTLLGGRSGAVFAMPGHTAPVYLVATAGQRCIVWAEGAPGPALHEALLLALDGLAEKTGRVEKTLERNIDRGGTWRRQLQWRYRRAGGHQDFEIDAVTTLNDNLGVQAFHFAPLAPEPRFDPDGMPVR